ncbi:MAG: hypothetical protein KDD55_10570, partial [Bdellovibrionales bacterium]|nr:hypothetical protein [Bdellovibrionales bacterium]
MSSDLEALEKISQLHEQGVLTDSEFEKVKGKVLAGNAGKSAHPYSLWAVPLLFLLVFPMGMPVIFGGMVSQGGTESVSQEAPAPQAVVSSSNQKSKYVAPIVTQPVQEEREPNPEEIYFSMGETANTENFAIVVDSVEKYSSISTQFVEQKPTPGSVFVAVRWRFRNDGKKPIGMFEFPKLVLVSEINGEYEPHVMASTVYTSVLGIDSKVLSKLNPGVLQENADAFEVPISALESGDWLARAIVRKPFESSGESADYVILNEPYSTQIMGEGLTVSPELALRMAHYTSTQPREFQQFILDLREALKQKDKDKIVAAFAYPTAVTFDDGALPIGSSDELMQAYDKVITPELVKLLNDFDPNKLHPKNDINLWSNEISIGFGKQCLDDRCEGLSPVKITGFRLPGKVPGGPAPKFNDQPDIPSAMLDQLVELNKSDYETPA